MVYLLDKIGKFSWKLNLISPSSYLLHSYEIQLSRTLLNLLIYNKKFDKRNMKLFFIVFLSQIMNSPKC